MMTISKNKQKQANSVSIYSKHSTVLVARRRKLITSWELFVSLKIQKRHTTVFKIIYSFTHLNFHFTTYKMYITANQCFLHLLVKHWNQQM